MREKKIVKKNTNIVAADAAKKIEQLIRPLVASQKPCLAKAPPTPTHFLKALSGYNGQNYSCSKMEISCLSTFNKNGEIKLWNDNKINNYLTGLIMKLGERWSV